MIIYLHDLERDEEVKVNLSVEYALPCHDLFAAFYITVHGPDRTAREYGCHRVTHLLGTGFSHAGRRYGATFGFFLSGGQAVPVLVDGACADAGHGGFRFAVAQEAYDHYPERQALFHYPGIPSLLEGGEKPMTFREAAAMALKGDTDGNRAYALSPAKGIGLAGLVGRREFSEFMER